VAEHAPPAAVDAACLRTIRRIEANGSLRIVGKTNLHELALGISGINPWFGTPRNPLDSDLVPGGSSSGSAVAVATGEADVALGSDTGGSIRIPAACCGVLGLKTTEGRISLEGVRPLAPSMDTVGPMAASAGELAAGMALLDPGFEADAGSGAGPVGRLRLGERPEVADAIDHALLEAELDLTDVRLEGWDAASGAGAALLTAEAALSNRHLLERPDAELGADVAARLERGQRAGASEVRGGRAVQASWRAEVAAALERVEVIALATLADFPPPLARPGSLFASRRTLPVNLAGLPALAMPVPAGPLPASLQLLGAPMSEGRLVGLASRLELAMGH
jgi:amidase